MPTEDDDRLGEGERERHPEARRPESAQSDPSGEAGVPCGQSAGVIEDDGSPPPPVIETRFVVEPEWHGHRLDRYLQHKIRRLSRARVQRILRTQATLRGQPPAKPGALVAAGDEVVIRRPWGHEPEVPRQVRIVYADQALLCVDKPAGLPMHPTARYYHHTLTALLRRAFPGQPLQLAHRLDRETSGLLLVARGRDAGSALKRAFASRRVHKCYLALVRGTLADDDGRIDLPLRLEGGSIRVRMRVCAAGEEGLPSRTRYRVLRRLPGHTLLEAWPETGRQHQIRAHLAAIGHPLVGDKLYGGNGRLFVAYAEHRLTAEMRGELGLERHALHAHRITFPHPTRGVEMTLESSLPEDIVDYLRRISLDANE